MKTRITSTSDLCKAVEQALEVKRLCLSHRPEGQKAPFTGVIAFDSSVQWETLFEALRARVPEDRVDFVFILKPHNPVREEHSQYIAHWHYYERGGGRIIFTSADSAARERTEIVEDPDNRLTVGESENALLWFYLFLEEELGNMSLRPPNLSEYALATKESLGYLSNG